MVMLGRSLDEAAMVTDLPSARLPHHTAVRSRVLREPARRRPARKRRRAARNLGDGQARSAERAASDDEAIPNLETNPRPRGYDKVGGQGERAKERMCR